MLLPDDTARLMREVQVELIGAAELHIKAKAFDVFTEFFYDSSWWEECIPVPVVPNISCYYIAPTDGQIIRLRGTTDSNGYFQPSLMPKVGVLQLRHAPNTAQTFYTTVVKNVVDPAAKDGWPVAPEEALREFFLAIKEGMIGNLMNEKDKSYSDSKGALYHLTKFRKGITDARIARARANTVGAQAWRFPQQFRANTQQGGVPSIGTTNERVF